MGHFKIYYNIYTQRKKKKYIVTIWKTDIMSSSYNEKKNKREQHLSSSRYIETGTVYNNIITLHPVEKDNFLK